MQLKKKKPIRAALAAATCALLGVTGAALAEEGSKWEFETGLLAYTEEERITVVEVVGAVKNQLNEKNLVSLKLTADSITGASPNGASATNDVQTFASPSGNSTYTTQSGQTPMDPNFKDTRFALSGDWEHAFNRFTNGTFGAFGSYETDFISLGGSMGAAREINNKNTTLTAGISMEYDLITPTGGIPVSISYTGSQAKKSLASSNNNKMVTDILVGVTQVVSRRLLTQFNYSHSISSGYLSDPYKILSAVDGNTGSTLDYVYENRPANRTKQSLYWRSKYHFDNDIADFSYRYMWDTWGITSHTMDLRYRWRVSKASYLEPHIRYYLQSKADFYRHSLVYGSSLPKDASADYRLADFSAITLGMKFGIFMKRDKELSARLEFYRQKGDDFPSDTIGVQQSQDLFPEVNAVMAQFLFSF